MLLRVKGEYKVLTIYFFNYYTYISLKSFKHLKCMKITYFYSFKTSKTEEKKIFFFCFCVRRRS